MKICVEAIPGLRFKIRMFGVSLDDSTKILCDNQSFVLNSSHLESNLNKKHSYISYHDTQWAIAAGVILVGWIPTGFNLADPMSKCLPKITRDRLFGD